MKDEKSKGESSKANAASDEKNSEPDGVWLAAIEDGRDINNLEEAYLMGVDSTTPSQNGTIIKLYDSGAS